jgi:hypothetical protein
MYQTGLAVQPENFDRRSTVLDDVEKNPSPPEKTIGIWEAKESLAE